MNAVRNWCAVIIGLSIMAATGSGFAGVAAWLFSIVVTYPDWGRQNGPE